MSARTDYKKAWRTANQKRLKAYDVAYYLAHREERKAYDVAYYLARKPQQPCEPPEEANFQEKFAAMCQNFGVDV